MIRQRCRGFLRRPQSLRWAVVAALLIGLGLPAFVTVLADRRALDAEAESDLQRDLARSTEALAIVLADPLWQITPELAEPLVKALTDDGRFVSVIVQAKGMSRPFLETHRMSGAIVEARTASRPIRRGDETIGSVTLTMTKAPYLAQRDTETRQQLWQTLGTLIVSLLLILWVIQRRILVPMDRLTSAAESLADGKLDTRLTIGGRDEIGRVGSAMERMRESLLGAFDALRRHAGTLEEKVEQRTAELRASNAELTNTLDHLKAAQANLVEAEKLASLGRLVAGVAHELNTPLGNAMTVVSTLEERYNSLAHKLQGGEGIRKSELLDLLDNTQQGHDLLRRNVDKAAELIRNFKQVAVDQSSEMRRQFDLAQVIEEVLITIRPRFKHTPFQIRTELAPAIMMDSFPGPFGQVLTNLALNALIHGFDGRPAGTLTLRCARRADGDIVITCEDDGKGMTEEVRRRIFDPFFTTRMGQGGSGLGLNIVHNIVTGLLGGRIDVSSAPGIGTRFEIVLPDKAPQIDR